MARKGRIEFPGAVYHAGDVLYARSRYQYDAAGREVATWRDLEGNKDERFYYATTNQLTNVRYNADQVWTGNPVNWNRWVDYGYQPGMLNRWYLNDNGNFSWVSAGNLNQYTTIGSQSLGYDANFNVTSYDGTTFNYNAQNQLVSASKGVNTIQFVYDGLGRCVRRTVNGVATSIAYDGWKPVVEWDGAGNFKAWNLYGAGADEILWRYQVGFDHLRYHHDRHGNVISVLAYAGNVLETYVYDAFGKPTILSTNSTQLSTSAVGNRFLFQGRESMPELGIYDYRRRMYHPGLGRFLQVDPLGLQTEGDKLSAGQKALFSPGFQPPEAFSNSEFNLYRYCIDDPVNRSDPTGLKTPEISSDDPGRKAVIELHYKDLIKLPAFKREFDKIAANPQDNAIKDAESSDNKTAQRSPNGLKTNNTVRRFGIRELLRDLAGLVGVRTDYATGATSFYNPTNRQTVNGGDRDPIFGLANELGEMINANNGTWNVGSFKDNDNRSIWFENQAREAYGAELRPYH